MTKETIIQRLKEELDNPLDDYEEKLYYGYREGIHAAIRIVEEDND